MRAHGFNRREAITRSCVKNLGMDLADAVVLLGAGGAGRVAALKLASENVGDLFLGIARIPSQRGCADNPPASSN